MNKSRKSKRGGKRPGAGRKPIGAEPGEDFYAAVPAELARQVDAKRGDLTRADVLRDALGRWVQQPQD